MDQKKDDGQRKLRRKRVAGLAVASVIVFAGAIGVQAFAQSQTYSHLKLIASEGGIQKASSGHRHGRHGGWGHKSDAEIQKSAERMVKHVAIEIDATPEQQAKLVALVSALVDDILPIKRTFQDSRDELKQILLAPTVDRAALEKLRLARFADAEKASKSVTKALADVAETLTLEQRNILNGHMEKFREKRRHWRRG